MQRAVIIGDGQMGLVLADALSARGSQVRIWCPFAEQATQLSQSRQSPRLANFTLVDDVQVTSDDEHAFDEATIAFNAIPTQFIRSVWQRLGPTRPAGLPVISVSKGFEMKTLMRPTQVLADVVNADDAELCVLSGPTIAAELAQRLPATMVAASSNLSLSQTVQDLLNVAWLRIYTNDDLLGVEVAGATKNVIALAAGMIDGLKAGDNAKSALLARGLAEIARLGVALGAKLDTFFGIAGVGDLATTCFSPEGRNRRCGEQLGRGRSLEEILAASQSVVEGVPTTKGVDALARQHGVDMPITRAVYSILFDGKTPQDAIADLMSRATKVEQIG